VNDDVLRVEWDDGHESAYGVQWLLERSFDEDRRDPCRRIGWTAESFAAVFRSFSYEGVIARFGRGNGFSGPRTLWPGSDPVPVVRVRLGSSDGETCAETVRIYRASHRGSATAGPAVHTRTGNRVRRTDFIVFRQDFRFPVVPTVFVTSRRFTRVSGESMNVTLFNVTKFNVVACTFAQYGNKENLSYT